VAPWFTRMTDRNDRLARMTETFLNGRVILDRSTPDRALELGKAAEHIVCADLILAGYRAFLADQGLPYDVVFDQGNDAATADTP
jgi:hypothetical protein